ncbi:hypothetical protein LguiA_003152 [Lonicera macranthoides]
MAMDRENQIFGVQELFNSYSGRHLDQVYEIYRNNNEIQGQDDNVQGLEFISFIVALTEWMDPKQTLCLYGSTNQQWEVILRRKKEHPPLGINLATKERTKEGWLHSIAIRSDSWLLVMAYLFTRGFDQAGRAQLFEMINGLPTVHEVVSATAENMPAISDMQGPNVEENLIKEGDVLDEQVNDLCGVCKQKEAPGNCELYKDEWIGCDYCPSWYHCKCEDITPAVAKDTKSYKCLSCCRGSEKAGRERLFKMINDLLTLHEEVVSATAENMPSTSDTQGPNVEENLIKEGDVLDEQVNNLCGVCKQKEAPGNCDSYEDEWIACDHCPRWYHCKCEAITPDVAKAMKTYKCLSCRSK